jgi:hypothetical protein
MVTIQGVADIRLSQREKNELYYERWRGVERPRGSFIPAMINVRLNYVDTYAITPYTAWAPNQVAQRYWRANGAFDPDLTGGGHQPRWYDQLSSMYGATMVMDSDIHVHIVPNTTANFGTALFFLAAMPLNWSPSNTASPYEFQEMPNEYPCDRGEMSVGFGQWDAQLKLHRGWNIEDYDPTETATHAFGNRTNWQADTGANPLNQMVYGIWGFNATAPVIGGLAIKAMISYNIVFAMPLFIPQS